MASASAVDPSAITLTESGIREMKVSELRAALRGRSLDAKGLKSELCDRLIAYTAEGEEGVAAAAAAAETAAPVVVKVEPPTSASALATSSASYHTLTAMRPALDIAQLLSDPIDPLKMKHKCISLDGLLDYNLGDKSESTFEVSVVAEAFDEMLQRDFGEDIMESLEAAATSPAAVAAVAAGGSAAAAASSKLTATTATTTAAKVNRDWMCAFRYFDRNGSGTLLTAEVKQILHNLPTYRSKGGCV